MSNPSLIWNPFRPKPSLTDQSWRNDVTDEDGLLLFA